MFRALKIENMGLFPPETVDQRLDRDTVEDQIAFWLFLFHPSWKPGKILVLDFILCNGPRIVFS